MANSIVFRYEEMTKCVASINEIAQKYKSAATQLQNDFDVAI